MTGPLSGLRVVEAGGIGPGPFAAMMLADMGADVLRIEPPRLTRETDVSRLDYDALMRGRRSVAVDIKDPEGLECLLRLVDSADVLLEGFRPGVAERLGFGPDVCLARRPSLVYGRITGWGQDGPLAQAAGHDINYIALAGVLAHLGRPGQPPVPPLNLVGDFGGGGMLMAFGIVCALQHARTSGVGQVVDAAMVDGAALLSTMFHGEVAQGRWSDELGRNNIDGGAPHYDVYETSDGKHIAVGAFEPRFFAELAAKVGLDVPPGANHLDRRNWPEIRRQLTEIFRGRTRDEWCGVLEGTDACFSPVLTMGETTEHAHIRARGTFVDVDGVTLPAPAPRFSATPAAVPSAPPRPGQHTLSALEQWGIPAETVADLAERGVVAQAATS
ncbi:CaiB/BaiF CoA-transferase family protein [Pseudonocardia ailaonensis]|uniref:CaiB/BaiF CoA-transferase family protein n=1 Tax=Pseudonocardia ailaonensis TaxID=367279 RepID=A0ABN2MIW5_9PSEU